MSLEFEQLANPATAAATASAVKIFEIFIKQPPNEVSTILFPTALCQHNAAAKKQKVIVFIFIAFIDVFIEYFCVL